MIQETIEQLKLPAARQNMNRIGRWLTDVRPLTIWERDNRTLSYGERKWRKRARQFAQEVIRPVAIEADLNHHQYDPMPLIREAAGRGFLSLLFTPPLGRASVFPYLRSAVLQAALIGEEFAVESGGIGLQLMAHYLGIAPLLLSGHLPSIIRYFAPLHMKSMTRNPVLMAFAITEPSAGSDVEDTEGGATARLITTAAKINGGWDFSA